MKFIVALVALFVIAARGQAAAQSPLSAVKTFAFALGIEVNEEALAKLTQYQLVVLDGEETSNETISSLRSQGIIVLGYVSVGTIERDRWWYKRVKGSRLELWGDWDEWYADVSNPKFRSVITKQVAPWILAKGFSGLFLDNVAMIDDYPEQRRSMFKLVRKLADLVHADGRYLMAQNGENVITPILPSLDGWNREDVSSYYDFDRRRYVANSGRQLSKTLKAMRRIRDRGLLVTATDYFANYEAAAIPAAVSSACGAGAVPFVSDINLTLLPAQPYTCP